MNSCNYQTLPNKLKSNHTLYERLDEIIKNKDEILTNHIDYLKDEVDIRIESLKNQLDEFREKFHVKLDSIKGLCEKQLNKLQKKKEKEDPIYLSLIQKWDNNPTDIENANTDEIKFFNDKIQQYINEFNDLFSKAMFEPSESSFCDEIIGKIESDLIIGENIKNRTYKPLKGTKQATSLCSINDEYILVADRRSNRIIKYNREFEIIEQYSNIGKMKWNNPSIVCTDEIENVYICNANNTEIVITDLHFKEVKNVLSSTSNQGFEYIKDMKFFNGCLYVLDASASSLHSYNSDGSFRNKILLSKDKPEVSNELLSNPLSIAISDEIIAVLDDYRKIYIYDSVGQFLEKLTFDNIGFLMSICIENNHLFMHASDGAFLCYERVEDNGKKSFKSCFELEISFLRETSEGMIYFNKQIVILLPYEKAFVMF